MKRAVCICFGYADKLILENIFAQYKHKTPKEFLKYQRNLRQLPLIADSPEYNAVIQIANEYGISVRLFNEVYYTKKEVEATSLFQMLLPYPLELEGSIAKDYGTKYEGGCPICGVGGSLMGDLLVDRKFMSKKCRIGNLTPDYYVSEEIKSIIESNNFSGISFAQEVKDYKGREISKYYVMNITNILPQMSKSTWLVPEQPNDEKCGHNIIYLQSDIQYEKNKLNSLMDFNLTNEYVNNWRIRELVVSAKVRKVFIKAKVYARYIPVALL